MNSDIGSLHPSIILLLFPSVEQVYNIHVRVCLCSGMEGGRGVDRSIRQQTTVIFFPFIASWTALCQWWCCTWCTRRREGRTWPSWPSSSPSSPGSSSAHFRFKKLGFCIDYGPWFVIEVLITVVDSNVDNDDGDDAMMMRMRMMTVMMR